MSDLVTVDCGVRQLHARFVDAVWRQDADAFGQCFTRDGEWKIAGMHMRGRDEVASGFARLLGVCERVQLHLSDTAIELSEGGATGRLYVTEIAKMVAGGGFITFGAYHDRYAEEDGRWRFRWRHWSFHYRGPFDLSGTFNPAPDYGPPPGMPGADEPTYVRPKT